ncbi:stk3 [Scenedesmus sp. PABB004]|nr:stk3 [Scenedesmus sp. PABB004]
MQAAGRRAAPPRCRRGSGARRCRSPRAPPVAAAESAGASQPAVVLDVDCVVAGLDALHTRWGHAAARAVLGGARALPPAGARLHGELSQLLAVVREPAVEAAMLVRLLADERPDPARLGDPPRERVTRPLLLAEIETSWEGEIRPTCTLRWCTERRESPAQLHAALAAAYAAARDAPWAVLDARGACHGSGGSGGSGDGGSSGAAASGPSAGGGGSGRRQGGSGLSSSGAALATAPLAAAAPAARAAAPEGALTVLPHTAVVNALAVAAQQQVLLASTYGEPATAAALRAAGVAAGAAQLLHGASLGECAAAAAARLQEQPQRSQRPLTFVVASPAKAEAVLEAQAARAGEQQPAAPQVLVAEWACPSPALRARALAASPRLGLLSEVGLAELLGAGLRRGAAMQEAASGGDGRGAYGSVYKAVDRVSGEVVAIKVISTTDSDEDDLNRIAAEIQFLSDCDHPNVVRYRGSFRLPGALWIVMEHCGGGSVGDLLAVKGEGLDEQQIAFICAECLQARAPGAPRRARTARLPPRAADRARVRAPPRAGALTSSMTKRNTFIGTPHWMAPEVIQESRYDGKVDVWALGISAIEMAELTPPRWKVHPLRVIFMISREPPPALAAPGAWSDTFADFLAQCLQKAAAMRPTARYLQQHRFVVGQRPANAACLAGLIEQAQAYLSARASPAPSRTSLVGSGGAGGARLAADLAGGATGHFSWRGIDGRDGRAGVQQQQQQSGAQQERQQGRGTALGQQPSPGTAAWGQTVLVSPGAGAPAPPGWGPGATVASAPQGPPRAGAGAAAGGGEEDGGSHFMAALASARAAAAAGAGGGASGGGADAGGARAGTAGGGAGPGGTVVSAAADREREQQHAAPRGLGPGADAAPRGPAPRGTPGSGRGDAGGAAAVPGHPVFVCRLWEHLAAWYESGLVVQLPFLSAAHAAPLALLGPAHAPGAAPLTGAPAGGVQGLDPEAHAVLWELAAHGPEALLLPRGADGAQAGDQQRQQQRAAKLSLQRGGVGRGAPARPGGGGWDDAPPGGAAGCERQPRRLPARVVAAALRSPGVQNLARSLAYHRACLQELPLDAAGAEELVVVVADMAATLQALLGL